MKITPVMTGGIPGQSLGDVTTERTSPDRIERAKAIALGQSVVTESDTPTDPQVRRAQETMRKIKMRTQVSPDRHLEEIVPEPVQVVPEEPTQSAISGTNEPVVEDTKPLSPQFAALAKAKRAFQLERQQFEREKAQLKQSTTDGGSDLAAQLKAQPLRVLQEQGLLNPEFYQSLTDMLTSGQAPGVNPELQALKDEIKALKEGVDKRFVDTESQAEESALTEMLWEAEALAKDGEDFALIRGKEAYDRVLRLIHSTYKKSGRVMDVREAMNQVESQLIKEGEFYYNVPKLKTKYLPPEPAPLQSQPQRLMRTLTNRDAAQPPLDRRTRALLAATGQLKRG